MTRSIYVYIYTYISLAQSHSTCNLMSQIALKKKESEGSLTTSGTDDVLTLALGNPEHPGRIRGVGGNVRRSTYFHLPKRRKQSVEQTVRISVQKIMEEEREKIVAEERAYWVERFMRLEAKIDGRAEGNVMWT